jgi:hypothetical protein
MLVALAAGPSGAWELVIGGRGNGGDGGHCPWRGAGQKQRSVAQKHGQWGRNGE